MASNAELAAAVVMLLVVLAGSFYLISQPTPCEINAKLTEENLFRIAQTDVEYSEFLDIVGSFEPELVNVSKLGPIEYQGYKSEWSLENSSMRGVNNLLNESVLTDYTYMVRFRNKLSNSSGLLAFVDVKEDESYLIIALIELRVGVGM